MVALPGSRFALVATTSLAVAIWVVALVLAVFDPDNVVRPIVLALLGLTLGIAALVRWHLLRLVWVTATLTGHALLTERARQEIDDLLR